MITKTTLKFNQFLVRVLAISLILNLGIGIYFFQFLSGSTEFATALLSLFSKIKILAVSLILSIILTSIVCLIFYKFKNIVISIVIATLLLVFSLSLNYSISSSIACPVPYTKEEQITISKERIKQDKEETNKMLKKAELFLPDNETITYDKNKIILGIKKLLSFEGQSSELKKSKDSVNLIHINELFEKNYSSPDISTFKTISDSLDCRFISYSPNYKHFIAILTYKTDTSEFDLNYYNGLVLFCEKKNNKIFVFSYSHPVSQYNTYTKDEFLYDVILNHFFVMGEYTLEIGGFKKHPHPFKKEFWQSKYFFSIIKIDNENYFRYQTELGYNYKTSKNEYIKRGVYVIE